MSQFDCILNDGIKFLLYTTLYFALETGDYLQLLLLCLHYILHNNGVTGYSRRLCESGLRFVGI